MVLESMIQRWLQAKALRAKDSGSKLPLLISVMPSPVGYYYPKAQAAQGNPCMEFFESRSVEV
jgi:hypothetical protein